MLNAAAFTAVVALVAAQRLWELRRSAAHEASLRAAGGREHAPEHMAWMRALHGGWLAAMVVEVWLARPSPPGYVTLGALAVFVVGQALRVAAMRELGTRWTVKIITLPGRRAIDTGVFSYVRHPNYLGVVLEIAALPCAGGAYATAVLASLLNGLLLRARIAAEERALSEDCGYDSALGGRPRFVPRASQGRGDG